MVKSASGNRGASGGAFSGASRNQDRGLAKSPSGKRGASGGALSGVLTYSGKGWMC